MKVRFYILFFGIFLIAFRANTQQIIPYSVPFATNSPQSMWGPNGINVGINNTWSLFNYDPGWVSSGWIPPILSINTPIGSGEFGAAMEMKFRFMAGLDFSLENFTLGQVEVDYPIEVEIETPDHLTYDQGDTIDVKTSYTVENGWALDTYYPNPGNAKLTLELGIGASLKLKFCFFDCVEIPVIPQFFNTIPIDIIDLDLDNWVNDGDGMSATFFSAPGFSGFEYNIPDTLYTSDISGDPLGGWGLSGWITPPNVVTSDNLIAPDLLDIEACGESQYVNMSLSILDLLSNIPYPPFAALAYFDDSYEFNIGGVDFEIWWNIFTAELVAEIYNKQCFDFSPKVYGRYEFPVPIEYQILDGISGAPAAPPDVSSIITCEVGNTIHMKYPCYFQDMEVTPTYSIDGIFTSHTYDSIPLSFCYSGLEAGINWSNVEIIPELTIPYPCGVEMCCCVLGVSYPCGVEICYATTPSLDLYDIIEPPPPLGPFIPETCIPITSVTYDWVPSETWSLDGFDEYIMTPFHLQASPIGVSNTSTNVDCNGGNDGTIDVTFSALTPALPYTFDWTNGATTQNLSGLTAGPYELSAYDANGCQLFTGATITHPEQPVTIGSSATNKSCNGGTDDGAIEILVQGGTPPYTYLWSNGAITQNISGLAAGTYSVTVTDSKGCQELHSVTVTEPIALDQVGAVTNVLCNGSNSGQIAVDVFGGTLPYSYSWDNGQLTEDITALVAGDYELTVTDTNNCVSVNTYTVLQPGAPVQLSITGVDILCTSDSTGSIDLSTSGGTPGYSYVWSNSLGLVLPFQSEDISNIPADVYTVVVTDLNNCIEQISLELIEPPVAISTTPNLNHVNCFGDATGTIDPAVAGGTPGYTYLWSDGSSLATLSNATAETYVLTVTDDNGCVYMESFELTEPTALTLSTAFTDVLCHGESTGIASVEAQGATPNYSFSWSNGQSSALIDNLPAGNYSVTVTDNFGCSETASVVIDQPTAPLSVSFAVTPVDCYGNASGAVDMTASDGTAPYSYIWATSGSVVLATTGEDLSSMEAGTYLLTITDTNGCILNSSVTIPEPLDSLSITGTTTDALCFGSNDGAIDIQVAGGTIGYNYLWSNASVNEDINTLIAGTYTVTVTDDNGCQIIGSYVIDEPLEPLIATVQTSDVSCLGGNDGYMISSVSGGTIPYNYLWSNADTTENTYNLSAGPFSLTVTDANGCNAFTGGVIDAPATFVSLVYSVIDVLCFGGDDGSITITPSGGTEPYYYNWGNQNDILMSEESETLSGLSIGQYLIRVIDANGCIHEETIDVNEPPLLETSNTSIDVLCYGDTTGVIDATIWGGTPPYSSIWSNGQLSEDANNLGAGWYYYEVRDDHDCAVSDSAEILEPLRLEVESQIIGHVTCVDQSDGSIYVSIVGGVEPYEYLWGDGSEESYVSNLEAGWYELIYTDANGCFDTIYYFVESSTNDCLNIPNTITPNGDLYNDTWILENIELYPNAEIVIFNKWGNELMRSAGEYTPWDGRVNGAPLPSAVYYYIILLHNDASNKYTGTITIIR